MEAGERKVNKKNMESNISHTESMNEDALRNREFEIRQLEKVIRSYGGFTHLRFLME